MDYKIKNYFAVFLSLLLLFTGCGGGKNVQEPMENTELPTEIQSENATGAADTEKPQITVCETLPVTEVKEMVNEPAGPVICDELSEYLEINGYTFSDIENSQQVITVQSYGCGCEVRLFECDDNIWSECYDTYGIVGRNGVSENSSEGSSYTPKGLFELGFAFGTEVIDDLMVDYVKITENSYWIDDPESEYYNQWVESDVINWNSAEHLIEYPQSYKYAIEIKYNMEPVIPYKGSAIFLHCAVGEYTAGCVAVPEYDMRSILEWVNKEKEPLIIIS